MYNLTNGRVTLKFSKSVLVQKKFPSHYSNSILNLCVVHELNNCPRNPTNNFPLKNVCSVQSNW